MARGHAKTAESKAKKNNGANLGFEAQLFLAADKLRKNLEPSDYKHVALGLIFLKHISNAFEAKRAALLAEDAQAAEDPDEYLAENVFWVPKDARWAHLQASAKQPTIGKLIDDAMLAIEAHNPGLKGVLPKDYNRPALDKVMLGELIDLISGIAMGEAGEKAKDLLGRVYEYFLGGFAGSEGKRGGEFYTPRSVVRVLVEMLEPYKGRVYDPCCGSGGMFVQSEKFVQEHGGRIGDIAIYGQESNYTTGRLAKMNLAVRGIDAEIRWNNEGSFQKDELKDLRFDHILANPPFNTSDWGGERLREDARWQYGTPPTGNANYAWLQHILWHLAPNGTAGVVLANGSMSSMQSGEGDIRRAMVEGDVVDCMIALPGQLFYSTQIPACLWFLARNKGNHGFRDRRGQVLFIDARKLGHLVDRTRRELSDEDVARIARTYHAWRGEPEAGYYEDVPGFCKSTILEVIQSHNYVLTPGRYVGAAVDDEDHTPFLERYAPLRAKLEEQFAEANRLTGVIQAKLDAAVTPNQEERAWVWRMSGERSLSVSLSRFSTGLMQLRRRPTTAQSSLASRILLMDASTWLTPSIYPEENYIRWTRRVEPQAGDVVFSYETRLGEAALIPSGLRCCLGRRMGLLRARAGKIDERFLLYAYLAPQFQETLRSRTVPGSTVDRIPLIEMPRFPIKAPNSVVEQRAIASLLGALDDKIELNRQMNETLEATARLFFKDWFVDFGPTRAKAEGRPPYLAPELWSLFPDALDDDDKPMGWRSARLGTFAEFAYGKALKAEDREPGNIPVFGSNGMVGWHSKALVQGPGVVIGRKGNPGTVNYVREDFFCIDTTFYAVSKNPAWKASFLWLFLDQLDLPRLGADSAVPGLNREIAYSAECVEPDENVIIEFACTVEPLRAQIAHNENENRTLAQTRDILLPKLMSGAIRLCEAEKLVEKVA